MSQERRRLIVKSARWIARTLALLVSGPFFYFLLFRSGEVVPKLSWHALNEMPLFVAWLAAIVGVLLSWRSVMIGGTITGASAVTMGVSCYLEGGAGLFLTCMLVAGPYLLSSLLLLGSGWRTKRAMVREPIPDLVALGAIRAEE